MSAMCVMTKVLTLPKLSESVIEEYAQRAVQCMVQQSVGKIGRIREVLLEIISPNLLCWSCLCLDCVQVHHKLTFFEQCSQTPSTPSRAFGYISKRTRFYPGLLTWTKCALEEFDFFIEHLNSRIPSSSRWPHFCSARTTIRILFAVWLYRQVRYFFF